MKKHGILISMSGKGNCFDNSMVETFFKTLKAELVWHTVFQTRAEAPVLHRPLHRKFLQPRWPSFGARFRQPGSVRERHGIIAKTLSTKGRQVQKNQVTEFLGGDRAAKPKDALIPECALRETGGALQLVFGCFAGRPYRRPDKAHRYRWAGEVPSNNLIRLRCRAPD